MRLREEKCPDVGRRRIVYWMGAAAVAPPMPTPLLADDRPATPRMTEGPFYPTSFPSDTDADLTRVEGHKALAAGVILPLNGRVVAASGPPPPHPPGALSPCDAHGPPPPVRTHAPPGGQKIPGFPARA